MADEDKRHFPQPGLREGLKGRASAVVTAVELARTVGSGAVDVFATPMMIALMERAAVDCVESRLAPGEVTVGTHIDVTHVAATPPGHRVEATAELVAVDGRTLHFRVEARDEREVIGAGRHTRVVVDKARFETKLAQKCS